MERMGTDELEQLIAAQLRGEATDLGEKFQTLNVERRLDQRISKGSGSGGAISTG